MTHKARRLTYLALWTSTVLAGPARSQSTSIPDSVAPGANQPQMGGLQDIVVTARRRSESIQKVPIAITALGAAQIEKANVQQIDKIAQLAPNLVIQPSPAYTGAAAIFIRGIGESDTSLTADSRVGVYLDGVYIARQAGALFDLVDIDRVEVLRGPQGTLFGRNTTGGAIQIVSKKPADEFGMTAKASYGRYDDWTTRGRIDTGKIGGLPLAASISYLHHQRDGYFDSPATGNSDDPGSINSDALTAALKGDFGALHLNYSYDRSHQVGAPAFFQYACFFGAPGCAAPNPDLGQVNTYAYFSRSASLGGAPLLVGSKRIDGDGEQNASQGDYRNRSLSQGHSLTAAWTLSPALSVKSITGFRSLRITAAGGLSQGGLVGQVLDFSSPTLFSVKPIIPLDAPDLEPQRSKQFSEEFQFSGDVGAFRYIVGAYYFRERVSFNEAQPLTLVVSPDQLAAFGIPSEVGDALTSEGIDLIGLETTPVQAYRQTARSKAGYAQISWKPRSLDENLEVTGGIRHTNDSKHLDLMNSSDGIPNASNTNGGTHDSNTSFLASASYQVRPSVLIYAKVSSGYKSGGINAAANGICDVAVAPDGTCVTGYHLNAYRPEKLVSYEVGSKMDLFDRRLRLNVAAFVTHYDDLQVNQFLAGSGGATSTIVNAGKAEYKGVELEATILPTRGLTLSGSFGYTDARYKQFLFLDPFTNTLSDISGSARFPNLAKVNTNLTADYEFQPAAYGTLDLRLSYSYRSRIYFFPNDAVSPFNANISSSPTNTLDARVALADIPFGRRAKAEVAVVGENLLNEDQVQFGLDFGSLGFAGKTYGLKRRASLQIRITY